MMLMPQSVYDTGRVKLSFCTQHTSSHFCVGGGRWKTLLAQFQHVVDPQPSLRLTLDFCRPASGPRYHSMQPERLRRRPPTTCGVLHQGRAAAHEADGKAERDGELHRDGESDGRSSQLPSFQGAANQGKEEGAKWVSVRTRTHEVFLGCLRTTKEPSHSRGGAPGVPKPLTLGARHLTPYDTSKKFVRATRPARVCASPKTNIRVNFPS